MKAEISSNGSSMPNNIQEQDQVVSPAIHVPALFRRIDWWAFCLATLVVLVGYLITIAPDVTLEDSGELAVGSMYAGVPHPPGYPVWTIYTWVFTKLLPFSNIAWRVAVASAVAGAFACGLIGLVVSRGSSMLLQSVTSLSGVQRASENRICLISGVVAGMLMGFNGYMWSQSVIVEVYSLSVLSLMGVLCCLLRWIYAPHQRRYLYWAFFLFGICLTNHMSLLVAAMGIQVAVAAAQRRLGRDFFVVNSFIYLLVILGRSPTGGSLSDPSTAFIFHSIGVASVLASCWLVFKTRKMLTEWRPVLLSGLAFAAGAAFYLYMPLASMTNPPMNWGYPRTAEGFMHALQRKQYNSVTPVNLPTVLKSVATPWNEESRAATGHFIGQLGLYANGALQEFTPVLLLVGLLPLFFLRRMQDRERAWIIGLAAIWLCLSFLLLLLLNPTLDRQSVDLHRVFFTASHVVIAIAVGYGLALLGGMLITQYDKLRFGILVGSAVAVGVALYNLAVITTQTFPEHSLFGGIMRTVQHGENLLPITGGFLLLVLATVFLGMILLGRERISLPVVCAVFLMCPLPSIISHWQDNEQRGHLFGYWFGHDMFSPPFTHRDGRPIYPQMARDAVIFGGTDPGRFNPTYMIFCESFTPAKHKRNPEFDRRDVYIITQNALADPTYLQYIRAHYNRSAQEDPPFFRNYFDKPVLRTFMPLWHKLDDIFLAVGEKIEKQRRVGSSWLQADDFVDLANLRKKLSAKADPVSAFIFEQLSPNTQRLLGSREDKALARDLADDLNRIIGSGDAIYDKERFQAVSLSNHSERFIEENPAGHSLVRWNRLLLEDAFPEIAKSEGGLYPDLEIITPSPKDSQRAFAEYIREAQQRLQSGQLRPGEDVKIVNGRVEASGHMTVMGINGILAKMIFDRNPGHEFYIEESFPLEWMFPHLTPFGIIMKINRESIPEITAEMVRDDHEFWRNYSTRLIGDWITYDTSVAEICEFAERLYLRHDYRGFKGDPKFIRDDNAQKSFSKLRVSIAGIYSWRLGYMGFPCPPEFRAGKSPDELNRVTKEAEFAFKQAFAFCPYSPEAVYRFSQFLSSQGRDDEAILIAQTFSKFDPENRSVANLIQQLENIKGLRTQPAAARSMNLKAAFDEITRMLQAGERDRVLPILDQIITNPAADTESLLFAISALAKIRDAARLEVAMIRMTQLMPEHPETWYDLAGLQMMLGRHSEAAKSLKVALSKSRERLLREPQARDLRDAAVKDARFAPLREQDAVLNEMLSL